MKFSYRVVRFCCLNVLVIFAAVQVQAGQYFQDFSAFSTGATNFADDSTLFSDHLGGTASVQESTFRELALTANGTGNTRSAFMLTNLDDRPVFAFSAKWNGQINGNFPSAADGFSFNFGQLNSLNLISTNNNQESGYGVGLSFGVQTSLGNNPGFYLRVNSNTVASLTNNPGVQWGTNNTTRHFWEVDWNYTNGMTVRVDGATIFTNVPTPGFVPSATDRFVWAARTGVSTEEVRLDNIVVVTGGNLVQIPLTSPYYKSGEYLPNNQTADKAFDGNINTKWLTQTITGTGYIGATCSSGAQVTAVYTMTAAEDFPGRDPRAWTLEGSNNGGSSWTSCGSGGGYVPSFTNRLETRAWLAATSTPFAAYRLNITGNNGNSEIQLAELRCWGVNPVSPALAMTVPVSLLTSNTAYLNGTVNSGGALNTKGWFVWGLTTNYGQVTAIQNLGTDSFFHPITAQITNLSPRITYHYQVVISNSTGVVYGGDMTFAAFPNLDIPWTQANVETNKWSSIALSADGTKMIASGSPYFPSVTNVGAIYISTNSGVDWIASSAPNANWISVASSWDGTCLFAGSQPSAAGPAGLVFSTNSGATWKLTTRYQNADYASTTRWAGTTCSADGKRLLACVPRMGPDHYGDYLGWLMGSDNEHGSATGDQWDTYSTMFIQCIAMSADGSTTLVFDNDTPGGLYNLKHVEASSVWVFFPETPLDAPNYNFTSLAISADGRVMAAVADNGLCLSTNAGLTWTSPVLGGVISYYSVAMSADGTRLALMVYEQGFKPRIYISLDSGISWFPMSTALVGRQWHLAMSADGSTVAAAGVGVTVDAISESAPIYVWHLPSLKTQRLGNQLALSWTTNQTGFAVQTTTNLSTSNWTTATNPVVLTNGEYRMMISPTNGGRFFRLGTP